MVATSIPACNANAPVELANELEELARQAATEGWLLYGFEQQTLAAVLWIRYADGKGVPMVHQDAKLVPAVGT
jgi:hypothetical protein